eukprot:TRINITY_DN30882_c0_g1_i1.p1 TRINITY_DN30882_c0_g1~~TRINITY_DN30882_c0_g1_i1.p1  ORF type:complete len:824 (-),score=141.35 TRINITY_DN30882_c0_g1_i1:48-2456(-)
MTSQGSGTLEETVEYQYASPYGGERPMSSTRSVSATNPNVYRALEELQHKNLETKGKSGIIYRDQLQAFEKSCMAMQNEIDMLKRNSDEALRKVRLQFNEKSNEIREEAEARQQSNDRLMNEVQGLKNELVREKKARASADADREHLKTLLDHYKRNLDNVSKIQSDMLEDQRGMPNELKMISSKLNSLGEDLAQEIRERKAAEAPFVDMLTNHREQTARDLRDHANTHHGSLQTLREALDKQNALHMPTIEQLRDDIHSMRRDFQPHVEAVPELQRKLEDVRGNLQPQVGEQRIKMEKLAKDVAEIPRQMQSCLSHEARARNNLAEDIEHKVARVRKELRDREAGYAEIIRGLKENIDRNKAGHAPAVEDVQHQLNELKQELRSRGSQVSTLQSQMNDLESSMHPRMHDQSQELSTVTQAVGDLQKKLEPRLLDIHDQLRGESLARKAFEDIVHPQLKNHGRAIERLSDDLARVPEKFDALLEEGNPARRSIRNETLRLIDGLRKEIDDHDAIVSLKDHVEGLMQNGPAIDQLRGQMAEFQEQLSPHIMMAPSLQSKLSEIEDAFHPRLEEQKRALDKLASDHADSHGKLDRQIAGLADRLDRENSARNASIEDNEHQITTLKGRMRLMHTDHVEASRKLLDQLKASVYDSLGKQQAAHEDGLRALRDSISGDKSSMESRLDALASVVSNIEESSQEAKMDDSTRRRLSQVDDIPMQMQELKMALESTIAKERSARERSISALEESMSVLDALCRDVGERFVNDGLRKIANLRSLRRDRIGARTQAVCTPLPRTIDYEGKV